MTVFLCNLKYATDKQNMLQKYNADKQSELGSKEFPNEPLSVVWVLELK